MHISRKDLGLSDVNSGCTCSAGAHEASSPAPAQNDIITQEYLVTGMTCSHCVSSVSEEIATIDGVRSVHVDLRVGGASRVAVRSEKAIEDSRIAAAVEEAGYSIATAEA
ncbi:hypothetical protein GCM10010988_39200 [Cnuibacter physcomitrellae]|uniref:Uncharacterized protein n=1 Tax=Cnuibacter physcomitrellae TaxID=1619308 RepID=A0A1X9LQT2_9MICO|nr:heavy-metal-associated domain-containing protein [Cnuibacter physcomitrellae]ARJ07545.1 hypothetical protein B5808_19285 [Cnuibacter physcomitrellae]GGI42472.1 hypothetical protein GCM10010988_39200 [Cnuibacter physcomitrellae]